MKKKNKKYSQSQKNKLFKFHSLIPSIPTNNRIIKQNLYAIKC